MPSILCKCGEKISYGEIPCKHEWLFISDVEFDQFSGTVDSEKIYQAMKHALKCPSCKRLWLFDKGFNSEPLEYIHLC